MSRMLDRLNGHWRRIVVGVMFGLASWQGGMTWAHFDLASDMRRLHSVQGERLAMLEAARRTDQENFNLGSIGREMGATKNELENLSRRLDDMNRKVDRLLAMLATDQRER